MSLFPAYAQENITESIQEAASVSPTLEASLLASDEEELRSCEESSDRENQASLRILPSPPPPPSCDYYQDRVRDTGNLRVSTLYYPGRPNYSSRDELTLGTAGGRRERRRRHSKRYFESAAPPPPPERDEAAARSAAYRRMLADAPTDVDLWLRYIHFLEWSRGGGAALQAAAEAGAALRGGEPRGAGLIRDARLELARRHLPATEYLTVLRDMIADEKSVSARCELWAELVESAGARAGAGAGEGALQVLRAALADVARHAPAYPRLLYAYGSVLRAAGLWESLVLLVELVATVNFPPSAAFPPRAGAGAGAEAERALAAAEEAVARGGLPLGARWARVERARAAAHWRPATDLAPDQLQADPQRAPLAGDVCDAVRGGAAAPLALAVALLMLAKVPLLGASGAAGAMRMCCAEGALGCVRAARRLPPAPAGPASPEGPVAARAALALLVDPPHYFAPQHGYRDWVEALWEACCGWVTGPARLALVCWRLRWMHTLLLLNPPQEASGRAEARGAARRVLRAWGGGHPLPFLQFARIEATLNGARAGVLVCVHAVRAALRDQSGATRLYAARVLRELAGEGEGEAAAWALVCAALQRPLPADEVLQQPPPAALVQEAKQACLRRCEELESEFSSAPPQSEGDGEGDGNGDEALLRWLLPGAGEWAAARVRLGDPRENLLLHRRLAAAAPAPEGSAAARYWEQAACALLLHGRGGAHTRGGAHALAPHAPHNALLAVCRGGADARAGRPGLGAGLGGARETETAAWGALLHALLAALGAGPGGPAGAGAAGRAAAAAARRAGARGGGGAPAYAAALELAARDPRGPLDPHTVLYEALDAYPQHKWLYVRGAAWGAEGAALADLLLERRLRLHALPLELQLDLPPQPPQPDQCDTRPEETTPVQ